MRTIPEVAEDIKGILNTIEYIEYCDGETLVDINELVDEILTINAYMELFKPPCKIGDEFFVRAYSDNVITHVKCTGYVIQEDTVRKIKDYCIWLDSIENPRDYWKLPFDDFKRQCFATKEQAEQVLEEMEDGNEKTNN